MTSLEFTSLADMQAAADEALAAPLGAVPSPCINVCQIDIDTGFCQGCWRTLDEIACWGDADDAQQRALWRQLVQRSAR